MKKLAIFLMAIFLITITGCKDDSNPADPGSTPTETGAGTMYCKIDGKSWSATKITGSTYPAAYATYTSGILVIQGTKIDGTNTSYIMIQVTVNGTGEYILGKGTSQVTLTENTVSGTTVTSKTFITYDDGTYIGKIKINKFDIQNKIASGTFYVKLKGESGNTTETRNITDGMFDVKWQ